MGRLFVGAKQSGYAVVIGPPDARGASPYVVEGGSSWLAADGFSSLGYPDRSVAWGKW
jgi:hypothetical protein